MRESQLRIPRPPRLFATILIVVFAVEAAVMFLLPRIVPAGAAPWVFATADGALLTVLSAPLLWWLVAVPLRALAVRHHTQHAALVETTENAVLYFDETGHVTSANRASRDLFGASPEELIGRFAADLLSTSVSPARVEEARRQLLQQTPGAGVRLTEVPLATAGAQSRYVNATVGCAEIERSRTYFAILDDVTDQQRARDALRRYTVELERARAEAEQAARTKTAFLAAMSHEIRTPMNGVIGTSELLLSTELDGEQKDLARTIQRSGESLLVILNDILDFSKIEAGRLRVDRVPCSVREVIEESGALLAPRARKKGIELVVNVDPDIPARVVTDPVRLRQIILNLAGNAVKFTSQGHVALHACAVEQGEDRASLEVSVEDTGIGIPESMLGSIFESFTQAETSTTRRFGGTGLGLTISKRLAELLGGSLDVRSVAGQGSTFTLRLPVRVVPPVADDDAADADRRIAGARILVVDDSALNRSVLLRQLARWGSRVQEAASGDEALRALRGATAAGRPFAVALLDDFMPGLDGMQLARQIRGDPKLKDVALVLLGSGVADPDPDARFAAGLVKPVRAAALRAALAKALAGRHLAKTADALPSKTVALVQPTAANPGEDAPIALVVDDNRLNQIVATRLLERLGWRAEVAANGREAVDMASRRDYAVVLMDCHMPELDGFAATAAIRALDGPRARVSIVALTADALGTDRASCLERGMTGFLAKPLSLGALRAELANVREARGHVASIDSSTRSCRSFTRSSA